MSFKISNFTTYLFERLIINLIGNSYDIFTAILSCFDYDYPLSKKFQAKIQATGWSQSLCTLTIQKYFNIRKL